MAFQEHNFGFSVLAKSNIGAKQHQYYFQPEHFMQNTYMCSVTHPPDTSMFIKCKANFKAEVSLIY